MLYSSNKGNMQYSLGKILMETGAHLHTHLFLGDANKMR